jgi:type I restriction enzyme R subunit
MSNVGQLERKAQDRVVGLFHESLNYECLGNWETRLGNSNIEVELLVKNLRARGYDDKLINKAVDKLKKDSSLVAACTRQTGTSTTCCVTA